MIKRKIYFLILLLLATIITGIAYYSKDQPIWITYEISATGANPMTSTSGVSSHVGKYKLPYSFQVDRVNSLTVHSPRIITSARAGIIIIGFTASEPVDFIAIASSEPVRGFSLDKSREVDVLANISGAYSYHLEYA